MASLTPTGLETITYGQQGWNAIVTANMQRLNAWLGKLLPLMDNRSRTEGAVPMWNADNGNWEPSNAVQSLQTVDERCGIARIEGNHLQKALSWHVVVSSPQHCEHTAFSPAFPLVEFMAEAFCRLFPCNFKEKGINPFL